MSKLTNVPLEDQTVTLPFSREENNLLCTNILDVLPLVKSFIAVMEYAGAMMPSAFDDRLHMRTGFKVIKRNAENKEDTLILEKLLKIINTLPKSNPSELNFALMPNLHGDDNGELPDEGLAVSQALVRVLPTLTNLHTIIGFDFTDFGNDQYTNDVANAMPSCVIIHKGVCHEERSVVDDVVTSNLSNFVNTIKNAILPNSMEDAANMLIERSDEVPTFLTMINKILWDISYGINTFAYEYGLIKFALVIDCVAPQHASHLAVQLEKVINVKDVADIVISYVIDNNLATSLEEIDIEPMGDIVTAIEVD